MTTTVDPLPSGVTDEHKNVREDNDDTKSTHGEQRKGDHSLGNLKKQSVANVPKRTEEEEKLRKRLHAKREEERLREILKRKKDSFRSSIANTNSEKNIGNDVKIDEKSPDVRASTGPDKSEKVQDGERSLKDKEVHAGKEGNVDKSYRQDTYDRRASSDNNRHRHHRDFDRRRLPPPRNGDQSRHRHGYRHVERPPSVVGPPAHSPYNHNFYDSRRPPPHQQHGKYPPPLFRERGLEDARAPRSDIDTFGRQRRFSGPGNSNNYNSRTDRRIRRSRSPPSDQRKRYRSRSRSHSRSGSSHSPSSYDSSSYDDDGDSYRGRGRSRRRRSSSSSRSSRRSDASSFSRRSRGSSSSSVSTVSVAKNDNVLPDKDAEEDPIPYSKDQRTIFVTQLVMRTTAKDLSKFFKERGIKVNEIELLRDRRSGQHKGSAYVELTRMIDVNKALALSGQAPSFQRFPILIKESEAERNLTAPSVTQSKSPPSSVVVSEASVGVVPALVASMQQQIQKQAMKIQLPPLKDANGQLIQSQKVYVGNLDVNVVTSQHLQLLFAPFGTLTEVQLQNGKGFAFLQYYDPKEAALAIQTMSGQVLAGRPMKTGWATNPVISINGVAVVTSNEFPLDAAIRVQNAYQILAKLTLANTAQQPYLYSGGVATTPSLLAPPVSSSIPTVAEARASLAATVGKSTMATLTAGSSMSVDPTKIGNADNPSRYLLVHNMFNKDEETDVGWENDLRDEFIDECGKYGTIISVTVVSREIGGKIYASFSDVTGAQTCARSLAGRWFDRRQLRVEYVVEEQVKEIEREYPPSSTQK